MNITKHDDKSTFLCESPIDRRAEPNRRSPITWEERERKSKGREKLGEATIGATAPSNPCLRP